MQESLLDGKLPEIDPCRFMPPAPAAASQEQIAQLTAMLQNAKKPLLLMGRVSRSEADWQARIQLAECLGARVLTSLRLAAAFPTDHPLHVGAPVTRLHPASKRALQEADLIVSFDWLDLAGTL
jgi:thiamine pyrophosphate-dependent acetolactate synthase large subunit-like protein